MAREDDAAAGARAEGASLRDRAMASAMTAYTAAHGHPIDHASSGGDGAERRWATPTRVATAAVLVLALLCGAVVLHAVNRTPDAVADLAPPMPRVQEDGTTSGDGTPGSDEAEDGADDGPTSPSGDGPEGRPAETVQVPSAEVVVHVVGQVLAPGVVTLPGGSRVADAVQAAGGSTPEADLAALNLARVLQDGEQVAVPLPGERPAAGADAGAASGASGTVPAMVDLNEADVPALDGLPGIGPVLAQRIVEWRVDNGGFTTVEELREVTGIGPAVLERLRDLVRV